MYKKSKRTFHVQLILFSENVFMRYMEKHDRTREATENNIKICIKDAIYMPE
jgi:hypothetical protein